MASELQIIGDRSQEYKYEKDQLAQTLGKSTWPHRLFDSLAFRRARICLIYYFLNPGTLA